MGRKELRQEMRKVKKTKTLNDFKKEMDTLHARAYNLAVKHYTEAAEIVLPPRLQKALHEKAKQIKEFWDGIDEIKLEDTEEKK